MAAAPEAAIRFRRLDQSAVPKTITGVSNANVPFETDDTDDVPGVVFHAAAELDAQAIGLTVEQVRVAIHAHRIAARTRGKNVLMPKRRVIDPEKDKCRGRFRKSPPARKKD